MQLRVMKLDSPVGPLWAAWDQHGLAGLEFDESRERFENRMRARLGPLEAVQAADELDMKTRMRFYFDKGEEHYQDLPFRPQGSGFQQRVWAALRTIPFGETRSYGEIAAGIGLPKAARAVGLANSQNPVAVIVPCHRVIGANGKLTGYAGGLHRKEWLLRHEARFAQPGLFFTGAGAA